MNPIIKVDLEKIGELGIRLIDKMSDAVAGVAKPRQIVRVAIAETKGEMIRERGRMLTEIERRALERWFAEESKMQENIESIAEQAIPQLEDSSSPENIDNDWMANFLTRCRNISDEEMQSLWARVLAGEANSPGAFSKRAVNLLESFDRSDAHRFNSLCGFVWLIGDLVPVILDFNHPIYNEQEIGFNALTHMNDVGLITFQGIAGFQKMHLAKHVTFGYYGTELNVELPKADNDFGIGKVLLTEAGQELCTICGSKPVEGFFDYVCGKWAKKGIPLSSPWPRSDDS